MEYFTASVKGPLNNFQTLQTGMGCSYFSFLSLAQRNLLMGNFILAPSTLTRRLAHTRLWSCRRKRMCARAASDVC